MVKQRSTGSFPVKAAVVVATSCLILNLLLVELERGGTGMASSVDGGGRVKISFEGGGGGIGILKLENREKRSE